MLDRLVRAAVSRNSFLDLPAELLDTTLDFICFTLALDDRSVVLVDDHFLREAEILKLYIFQLDAELLRDRLAPG